MAAPRRNRGPAGGPPPRAVQLARGLLYLDAVVWLAVAIAALSRPAGLAAIDGQFLWILSGFMAANAALLALAAWLLGLQRRAVWIFALAVLALNIAASAMDQTGGWDWAALALPIVIAGLLIGARGWFRAGAEPLD